MQMDLWSQVIHVDVRLLEKVCELTKNLSTADEQMGQIYTAGVVNGFTKEFHGFICLSNPDSFLALFVKDFRLRSQKQMVQLHQDAKKWPVPQCTHNKMKALIVFLVPRAIEATLLLPRVKLGGPLLYILFK